MELLAAAVRGQKSDERTVGLLALQCAANLHHWFMPQDATIKRRLEDLVPNHWIANRITEGRIWSWRIVAIIGGQQPMVWELRSRPHWGTGE
jgi:hypothetical protein